LVDQFIVVVGSNSVKALAEFGAESLPEAAPLLLIRVCMVTHILALVVEGLGILQHRVSPLG
jgi:hypothetical protein